MDIIREIKEAKPERHVKVQILKQGETKKEYITFNAGCIEAVKLELSNCINKNLVIKPIQAKKTKVVQIRIREYLKNAPTRKEANGKSISLSVPNTTVRDVYNAISENFNHIDIFV